MITDPKQIVYEMEKALFLAKSGRKGPVWIDVPLDIQNMRIEPGQLEQFVVDEEITIFEPLDK
jgi:acetolactate synthase-1/2/3 large subunit